MADFMNVRKRKNYRDRRSISPTKSKLLLRFQSENIDYLSDYFLPEADETRGGALAAREKMQIFLRYVSDTGFQIGIGEDFGVHHTTICKTINNVADCIFEKAHNWIKFPSSLDAMEEARIKWSNRFEIPTVIGALDCTHIQIKKPPEFGDDFINRKGFSSINVQVTCDANEVITSVDAQWPGSVHDSRIWRQSSIYENMTRFRGNFCLLGDSGYGIAPWLVTPFKNPQNRNEQLFNITHSKERVIIERVFGQLKQRFPILGHKVKTSLSKVPKIIVCCAVLHNISKHLRDEFEFALDEMDNPELDLEHPDVCDETENNNIRQRGTEKRQAILETMFNDNNI